jgi:hypothetical protein
MNDSASSRPVPAAGEREAPVGPLNERHHALHQRHHRIAVGGCPWCPPAVPVGVQPEPAEERLWGHRWSNGFVTEYDSEDAARAGMQGGTKDVTLVWAAPLDWKVAE